MGGMVITVAPGVPREQVEAAYTYTYYRRNRSRLLQYHAERYENEDVRLRKKAQAAEWWIKNRDVAAEVRRVRNRRYYRGRRFRELVEIKTGLDVPPEVMRDMWKFLDEAEESARGRDTDAHVHAGQRLDAPDRAAGLAALWYHLP